MSINKTDSKKTKSRKSITAAAIAVFAVAILIASGIPLPAQGGGTVTPEEGYSGEYHVVRYHLNAPANASAAYNDTAANAGDGDAGDPYLDVLYYGSIVSTEYNPQLWASTIPTRGDVDWNWLQIKEYSVGGTYVFTGWRYGWQAESVTHYPGEVMSKADLQNTGSEGVLDVYATWGLVKSFEVVSAANQLSDAMGRLSSDGTAYTNFLLLQKTAVISLGSLTTTKPLTIRTEPVDDFSSVGRFEGGDTAYIRAGAPLIIDDVGIKFRTTEKHGTNSGGISGCGYPLIIGTGIMSYFTPTGDNFERKGYASLRGGAVGAGLSGDITVGVYPAKSTEQYGNIASVLIVHSGTWTNVIAGNSGGTTNGSVYSVLRSVTVLDTYACGGTGGNGNVVRGSTYGYMTDANIVSDSYQQKEMGISTMPYKFTTDCTLPPWPFVTNVSNYGNAIDRAFVFESTIITGGGGSGSNGTVDKDTNVYISGTSMVWDAQAAGRSSNSPVKGTGLIELSGKAISQHILCGSSTDGSNNDSENVKNTKVTVKDSAMAATVCGGGYDTWSDATGASMKNHGTIEVNILGGTVYDVFGGGFRALVGTSAQHVDSISINITGGRILGSVYGGGSGGLDKLKHNADGTFWTDTPGSGRNNTTGRSRVYADTVTIDISGSAVVEGNVYGGGKSVPAIEQYYGTNYDNTLNGITGRGSVATLECNAVSITVRDEAAIHGDVFGAGRGVKVLSTTAVEGDATEYVYNATMTPSGMKFIKWRSNGNPDAPLTYKFYRSNSSDIYNNYASAVVAGSISISIEDEASVAGSVYGTGARSIVSGTSDLTIGIMDEASVAGSVYGGGMKKASAADTVTISLEGSAAVAGSVFGAGAEGPVTLTGQASIITSEDTSIGDSVFGGGLKESLSAASILIDIGGSTEIESCVYGAGSEGPVVLTGTASVHVGDNATVAGSVYGGGLKETLTGNTSVTVDGSAKIRESLYGGGDIGERDPAETEMQTLVIGNSYVFLDGSDGASVAMSILGGGNSCLVSGNRAVLITDYIAPARMESLQSADSMDVVRSTIYLDGRGIGATASPSLKYSLYDIGKLRLMDGSRLGLSQEVDEVREYESCIANGELTTVSNPSNTLVLSGGVMFNTSYKRSDGYRLYGLISGCTILAKDVSDDFYGAYAYGSQESPGQFVQTKEGLFELIHYVDKDGEDSHDEFRLWTISGAVKQNVVLVATYIGSGTPEPSVEIMTPMTHGSNGTILFTGATVSLEADADLVPSAADIEDEKDMCIIVGYGDEAGFTKFNYVYDAGSQGYSYVGVPITGSFAGSYVGSEANSVSKVNIGMWYRGDIPFTGDIGKLNLEFQEVVEMTVGGAVEYVPICKTEVVVTVYCMAAPENFASQGEEVRHSITIAINEGSGSGKLVIPNGYEDGTVTLVGYEGMDGLEYGDLSMFTSVSSYGTSGWVGATGKGGPIQDCAGVPYALSGSFTARLNFEATGIDDTEMARVPTLHFIITDKDGNSNYYRLEIHFESIKRHKVEFYAPNYDSGILNDLRTNWMTTVIPPLFTLESSSTVNHGDRLASTDYPVTYEYFQGWYLNPECTKYFDTTSEITDDLKLYGGYSFKAIFHLYGETYETYNKEIVSGSVAMLEALYEDETVSVQTTYHYKSGGGDATYTETRHLGQTYVLPGPGGLSPAGDASDFKGWLLNGKVYDAGETFTVYSSKADLYAVYSDESAEATVFFAETAGDEADVLDSVTCYIGYVFEPLPPYMGQKSGEFRGWVCDGALYEPGERFVVSKEETVLYALFYDQSQGYHLVTGEEVVAHPGSKIHLPIPAYNIEKFRGWLVGGAFYYLYGSSDLTVTVPDGSVGYQPIYASDAIVSLTFSGGSDQPIQISRNNGDSLRVPAPDDMEGFVGWYSMGRVYQPGDLFVAMTDQATSDSVEFIALYNDEGSSSNATLLRAERLEFLCDNPYQAGDEVWVPTGTSWDAYNPGSVDTEYVMAADQREDFRGWKVGQAYYLLEDRASAYVVTRSDEVAVPVYETDDLPAVLLFDDGNSAVTGSYGSMVYLPEPTVPEDFVGWYSKGYVFPAGYRYVITDELTEFTAMHYGPNNTDSHILETPDPEMLYILHGNVYTYAEAKELYVPDSIDEWDGYFDEFDEHGNPVPDYDVTVRVYFGNSMNDMLVNPGQKDVVLPDPAYKEGFKGWLAGGVLYEPDENGVCKYTVQELYSYMHPIDVSEIALSNPGHHLEPDRKWWYDDDENLRFYVEDPETGIVDDIDHIVDDTVFHLNWIGNTLNIIPLVDSGSGYESLGADYEFEAVYGGQYGRPVVIATEKARELLGQNGHLAWMIAKNEDGSYVSTEEEVFETSTVFLDNYRSVVEPGDIDTLYIMAVLSVDSIRVKLYPGGTYIPLDSSTVTFEAMFEPVDMGSGATYAAVFDIDADGFDADDVEIQTCYGGSVALPMPDTLTGFVGWTRSIPGGDPAVYTGEYVFSDTNSVDQSGKAYFTPVYVDRSVACEAVFNVDITKGKMVDWPESSSKTVAAYKGQTVGLPDVKAENGFVFAGWMENGKIVKGDVIVVADTVLTASFAPAGSENATLVFNCDSGKGYCATSSLSAAVGNETTLPSVAPLDGYKFTGWKIVSDGRPAQESGFINLPTEFDVASDETGTSFDIVFREGYRTGHYLSGWKFSQYVDGVLREHVYTMRETPTVTKTGNTYSMSCDTGGPFEVTGFIEFEAIWTPISYVIEIQAPSEGAIRYRLPGSSEVFEVTKESGTASITAKYGDDIEMEYIPQLGSPYSFNRWTIVGEGDIIRDGMRGSLYVTGDASVGIALKQTFGYILTVYQPATGKGKVISDAGTPLEDSGTDHVNYRIIGGTPVTLHYITETDDTIHLWGVQNALKPDEDGSVEFTISGNTIAMPYLELRGMTAIEDVYAAFPENTEGVYSIPIASLGSVSAIAQAPDDMVATWDADDQVLVLTGAADVRGYVTVDVTVDNPIVASEFKVHVFIVGPLADGGLKTLL